MCYLQDLPDNELFWPPITLRVMDIRNFGRETLVGTATISNVTKYVYVPEEERRRKAEAEMQEKERIRLEKEREKERLALREQIGESKIGRKERLAMKKQIGESKRDESALLPTSSVTL